MGLFDDIKQALNGNSAVLTEEEQPSPTNFIQKLQNARADVTQKKVGVAKEVFGNGNGNSHKNTAAVAEQKARIKFGPPFLSYS